jgi:hypothetical protein
LRRCLHWKVEPTLARLGNSGCLVVGYLISLPRHNLLFHIAYILLTGRHRSETGYASSNILAEFLLPSGQVNVDDFSTEPKIEHPRAFRIAAPEKMWNQIPRLPRQGHTPRQASTHHEA